MKPTLTHCAQEVYTHDRDRFLLVLFIPPAHREAFFSLYALNLELARVPGMVSEEMVGHIRYAWWQEAVEGMLANGSDRGHPVLQALREAQVPGALLLPLVTAYRDHYPERIQEVGNFVDELLLAFVHTLCPLSERRWQKAQAKVKRHRIKHPVGKNHWLALKLLIQNI